MLKNGFFFLLLSTVCQFLLPGKNLFQRDYRNRRNLEKFFFEMIYFNILTCKMFCLNRCISLLSQGLLIVYFILVVNIKGASGNPLLQINI